MTDAPDGSRSRSSDSDAAGIQPRSLRTGLLWIGFVLLALVLLTPTLGSHGPNARFYRGEHFVCMPALGPTTSYPVNMWEEWPEAWNNPANGITGARAARSDAKDAFEVAVCAEQRSRRVAWALVVAIPTLAIALTGRRPPAPAATSSSDAAGKG
ncbi:MAG: hypothetical protein ACTH2Q_08165 [Propionibacteriaceae bacterium]